MFGLWFINCCTTETLRRRLVEALVIPHLDYCSVYLDASQGLRERLQRLRNTCVRYIFGLTRDARITPYRRRLGWLRMDSRRLYFTAILMYKIMRIGQLSYLKELFTMYRYTRPVRGDIKELKVPFMTWTWVLVGLFSLFKCDVRTFGMPFHPHFVFCLHSLDSKEPYANTSSS